MFQEDRLIPWKTVYENIAIVSKDKSLVQSLIEDMKLDGFEKSYPEELSGGMRQRCSIARAFNYKSDLLLMDEPFKSLDYNLRISMVDYLLKLWEKSQSSVVFVTHEVDEALLLGNRIQVLSKRPTYVIEELVIDIRQRDRKLSDRKLNEIRNRIIENILE